MPIHLELEQRTEGDKRLAPGSDIAALIMKKKMNKAIPNWTSKSITVAAID
jgi:hypothetical protein